MITAYPSSVAADASSIIVLSGIPYVTVIWSLIGTGTLVPITTYTGAAGTAHAIYTPGIVGETVTIQATHGTP